MAENIQLTHEELGLKHSDAAKVVAEVTLLLGKKASHAERIKELEKKFEGKQLLLAIFTLGYETSMSDFYYRGINEYGVYDPALAGSILAQEFMNAEQRYNYVVRDKKKAIKLIEQGLRETKDKAEQLDKGYG